MEPTQDYKSRSDGVRRRARSDLALIRQTRLGRRAATAEADPPAPGEPPVAVPIPDDPPAPANAGPLPPPPADAMEPEPPLPGSAPQVVLPPPAVPADSDLFALPGAGSGLVWMLRSCGIDSLGALAAADPDRLSAELGLIGQILDLRDWIAFARAQTDR